MPALEAFGRRWHIASDDFVILEVCDICLRTICLAIAGGIFLSSYTIINEYCEGQYYINFYVCGILTLSSLVILANVMLIRNSKSGSIIDNEFKRKYVPLWLLIKWILQLTELTQNITGTVWGIQGKLACTSKINILTSVMIAITWLLTIVRLFLLYSIFNPIGSYKYAVNKDNAIPDPKLITEWQRKAKLLSFLFTGKRLLVKEAIEEFGYMMGSMFEDVDIVVSDVFAGIILLIIRKNQAEAHEQNKNGMEMPPAANNSTTTIEEVTMASLVPPLESWNSLGQLDHFSKYAKAAFTWSLLLADGGMSKMKDLWKEIICCGPLPCNKRKMPFDVIGDNCYSLRSAGLKAWHFEQTDIIYADFENDIFELPFFVAVDHPKKAIVVTMRGTAYANDCLVDVYGKPHPMGIPGFPESFKIHHGMLRCSHVIKEKLDRLQLLQKLFITYPDYNLVLTGTSLGCGVAVALSFMLKNDYPTLKCYSFSPPGGMLSLDAAEYCKDFVISVIYGDDFIGRLSIQSLEKIKYEIMEAIAECPTPKYQVLLAGIKMLFGGTPNIQCVKNSPTNTKSASHSNGSSEKKNAIVVLDMEPEKSQTELTVTTTVRKHQPFERLYPPGKLLHLRETEYFHLGHKNPNYKGPSRWTIRWADRSEFCEFVLSSRFWFDHLPFRMPRSLKKLAEEERD